jgi:hypothetical protein
MMPKRHFGFHSAESFRAWAIREGVIGELLQAMANFGFATLASFVRDENFS